MDPHETILVLDFGSQYTQLIARRVRELGVYTEVLGHHEPGPAVLARRPRGIVLSGGPDSVYREGAPRLDPALLEAGVPVLGICYGMQLLAHLLGGGVERARGREYGSADITILKPLELLAGIPSPMRVWMSHGDHVAEPPAGFEVLAATGNAPVAAMGDPARRLYGIQFHPEVSHTPQGMTLLGNFAERICGCRRSWSMSSFIAESIREVRERARGERVVAGISGGVDSAVAAALVHRAIGSGLVSVFVDTGLLRKNEAREVLDMLRDRLGMEVRFVEAGERFLRALRGLADPERKRKAIGETFIRVFEEAAEALGGIRMLVQGTLYPDVIESTTEKGPSSVIKSHHNVGGLPEKLGLEILEPLRWLFKDEVRRVGMELGVPEEIVQRHPFPGPGLAVRVLGEVTEERLAILREADAIFLEELRRAGLYAKVQQAFAVLLPVQTVGVMGDERTYENVLALRSVDTQDFMTADWSRLPEELLARVSSRIVNEVRGVNRVVYDITTKPPGTIEWE